MIFRVRKADGQIGNMDMSINCSKFRTAVSGYGVVERVACIASKIKPECYECSLNNPTTDRRKASKRKHRGKHKQSRISTMQQQDPQKSQDLQLQTVAELWQRGGSKMQGIPVVVLGAVFAILFITIFTTLKRASLFGGGTAAIVALCVSLLCIVGLYQFLGPGHKTPELPVRDDKSGIGLHTILLPYATLAIAMLLALFLLFLLNAFRGERLKRYSKDTERRIKAQRIFGFGNNRLAGNAQVKAKDIMVGKALTRKGALGRKPTTDDPSNRRITDR